MLGAQAECPQKVIFRVHGKGNVESPKQTTFKGKTSLSDVSQLFFKGKYMGVKWGGGQGGNNLLRVSNTL